MVHEVENVEESLTMASEQLSNAVIRSFRSKASCSTYYGTHNRSVNFQRNKENFVYSVVDVAHRGVAFLRGQGERAGQSPQAFQEALDTAFEEVLAAGNLPNERAREACRADFQQVAKWVGLADVIQYHVLAPSRDLQVPAQCVAVESEEGPRLRTGQEIWDLHIQLGRTAEAIADPLSSRKRRAPTPLVMRLRRDRWNGMSLVEYMTEELRQENDSTRQAPLRRGEDMWFNPGSPTTTDATPPSIGDTGAFSALPAATQPQDPQSRLRQQQSIPEEARPPAVQPPQPGLLPPCTDGAGPPAVLATWPPGRQLQPRPLEELVARHSPSDPPAGLAAPSSATLSLQQQPPLQPPPQPQPRPLEELVARHSPSDPPAGLAAPSSATLSLQQQPPLQPPPQPQPLEELAARHSPSDPPAGLAAPSSATLSLQQQPPLQPPPQPQPLEELAARHSPSDPPAGLAAPSSATLSLQQQPPLQPPPQPQPLEELAARHSPSDPPAGLTAPSSATLSLQQQPPLQPPPQPQLQPLEELVARHSPSDPPAGLAAPSSATLSLQQQPPLQPLPQPQPRPLEELVARHSPSDPPAGLAAPSSATLSLQQQPPLQPPPQPQPLEELAAAGYLSFLLRDDGPDVDGNDWPGGIPFSPWVAPLLQHRIQQPTPPTRAAGVGAPVGLAALSPATLLLQQQPPQQPPPLAGGGQLAAENSPAAGGEPAARTEVGPAAVAPAQQQADVGDLDEGLDEELAAEEELATEAAAASPGHDDDNLRKTMVKDALDVLNKQQGMNFLRKRVLMRFVWKYDRAAAEANRLPVQQPPASDLEAKLLEAEERKIQTSWFSEHKKKMEAKNRVTSIVCPKCNILTLQQSGACNGGWSLQVLGSSFIKLQPEELCGLQEVRPVAGPAPPPRQPVAAAGLVGAVAGAAAGVGLPVPLPGALPRQHAVAATGGGAAAMPIAGPQQVVHTLVARPAPHLGGLATGARAPDPQVQQQQLTTAAGLVGAAGPSGMGPQARTTAVPFPPPPPEGLVTGPIAANHQQQQPRTAAAEPGTRFEKGQRAGTIKAFAKMIEDQRDITWDQAIAHLRSINVAVGAMPDDKLIDAWKKAAKAAGIAHGVPSKPRGARGEVTRGDPAVAVPGVDGIRPGVQADPRMRADTAALDWDAKVAAVESALAAPNPDGVRVQQLYDELRALACPVPNRAEILQRVYSRIAVAFSS
ncbi:hypothetical protein PLESTM_001054000 [Pleodorina starrii]|nr:hypothetical protein PLESTM_001054000 [Pleodorina starrii]